MKPEHAQELQRIHQLTSALEQLRDLLIRNGDRSKAKRLTLWQQVVSSAVTQTGALAPTPTVIPQDPGLPLDEKSA